LDSTTVDGLSYNSDAEAISRMKGVFIPNMDAAHRFDITADSEIRFKFNSAGSDAAGAVRSACPKMY